jgi:hypothetical protein
MKDDTETKWQLLSGDGSSQPMPEDKFNALKTEFDQMAKDAGKSVNDRRELAEDTRFCRWEGQSPDGRKHAEAMGDMKPFPFEGASDARVRTADGIGQEQVIVLISSLMRMQLGVMGTEARDMELAADVNVLWRWLEKNQLGSEWFIECTKMAQYRQNDSPGVGILQVWWDEQKALKELKITPQLVVETAIQVATAKGAQVQPDEAADLQDIINNVARAEEFAGLLISLWPDLPRDTAKRAAAEIQETGETSVAYLPPNTRSSTIPAAWPRYSPRRRRRHVRPSKSLSAAAARASSSRPACPRRRLPGAWPARPSLPWSRPSCPWSIARSWR